MPPLRPSSLTEALEILARPMLVQITAGGPPPRPQPHALLMDTGRINEMSGIHRRGGEIVVGMNTSWQKLQQSSLLHPGAAALVAAASLLEDAQPGGVLLHTLDSTGHDSLILLAMAALDAQIEIAALGPSGRISRLLLPWQQALLSPPAQPYLPINLRFSLPLRAVGSALHAESNLSPLQPDARAAAALISLDPDSGHIRDVRLALAVPHRLPVLCPAVTGIVGMAPGPEVIARAVELARSCQQMHEIDYFLALSPHLLRETLDLALARATGSVY